MVSAKALIKGTAREKIHWRERMFINCVASLLAEGERESETEARKKGTDFYDSLNVFAMILSLVWRH
jgi:hypothetical protein